MTISIDTEIRRSFDKIQDAFMIRVPEIEGLEGTYLSIKTHSMTNS